MKKNEPAKFETLKVLEESKNENMEFESVTKDSEGMRAELQSATKEFEENKGGSKEQSFTIESVEEAKGEN